MIATRRVCGLHAVRVALEQTPERIESVWIDRSRRDRRLAVLYDALQRVGAPLAVVDKAALERLAGGARHQGVVIELRSAVELDFDALKKAAARALPDVFYLVLDQVQDPHNLGACLRTADATGVAGIVVPKNQSAGLTPTVCKVASGAAETVPLYRVTNLVRALRWLREEGVCLVGTAGDADQTLFEVDLTGPLALVMGAEEKGLRRLTREACDLLVRLPMFGRVESLNVSVAAGVCLYEAVRQRRETAGSVRLPAAAS